MASHEAAPVEQHGISDEEHEAFLEALEDNRRENEQLYGRGDTSDVTDTVSEEVSAHTPARRDRHAKPKSPRKRRSAPPKAYQRSRSLATEQGDDTVHDPLDEDWRIPEISKQVAARGIAQARAALRASKGTYSRF